MNRLLRAGKFGEAIELIVSELKTPEIKCSSCAGYCENACRRKKIDLPVSIRNIRLFIHSNINVERNFSKPLQEDQSYISEKENLRNRFSSRTGKLSDAELKEWIRESDEMTERYRVIESFESASSEAASCMHCDCRASQDCALRNTAEAFSLKDPTGKLVNAPIEKKINRKTGLIFENAKCIKCGLCVRICEDSIEEPALCFMNRGFVSIISEPLTDDFENILATQAEKVIAVCPTGALSSLNSDQ
jgi:ferredoxin